MAKDRLVTGLIAVAILAFLDSIVTQATGLLPFVLMRAIKPDYSLFSPIFAGVKILTLIISPVGAFLLGYYAPAAFDGEATLAKVTAFVFAVGYICSAVGFLLGFWFVPWGVIARGSFLTQLLTYGVMAVSATVELTIAVVGGSALARVKVAT